MSVCTTSWTLPAGHVFHCVVMMLGLLKREKRHMRAVCLAAVLPCWMPHLHTSASAVKAQQHRQDWVTSYLSKCTTCTSSTRPAALPTMCQSGHKHESR
jgi:hypothetical protein